MVWSSLNPSGRPPPVYDNNQSVDLPLSSPNNRGNEALNVFNFYFLLFLLISVIVMGAYCTCKCVLDYISAKAFSVTVVRLPDSKVARVGETITLKVSLFKIEENGQAVPCSVQQVEKINKNISFEVKTDGLTRTIAILKSLTHDKDGFFIRFSIRKSGVYTLEIKTGFFNFVHSPFPLEILPGLMLPSKTILNVENPNLLCIVADQWHQIKLTPQDRYGNSCQVEDVNCAKFQLTVKFGDTPIDSSEMDCNFLNKGNMLLLNIKLSKRNIYKGQLTFDGLSLEYSDFTIVCMSTEEDQTVRKGFSGIFNRVSGPCKGVLLSVGSKRENSDPCTDIWVNVNYRQIAISSLVLGLIYYPFAAFRITRRTQILFNGLFQIDPNENENVVSLKISDGIQPSVILTVSASDARVLLATFSYFQGQKLTNYEFGDKVKMLKSELRGFFSYFQKPTVMELDPDDLLASTVKYTMEGPMDWIKPLVISFKTLKGDRKPNTFEEFLSTDKWLALMIENIFEHSSSGLFSKHGSSRLLHPTLASRRTPSWKIHHYEFCGSVLAKSVYDSNMHDRCIKLNHIRFTRSFLALLIGIPVNYKHFETDDPAYYIKHIKPILNLKDNESDLTFTQKDDGAGTKINLIPNGSNIRVTKRNKDKYLNLMANHKLKNRYTEEVDAFRIGFYKIIPQGLLTDFNEDELEKVICSGSKGFELEDLKQNCRIIGDLLGSPASSETTISEFGFPESEQQKMVHWLWTVIANMSDAEHEKLLRMTTGSLVLPSCGFRDLNPKFTIALTGNHNKPPTGHPSLHQISLGNHSSFESFENNFLTALHEYDGHYEN